MGSLEEQIDRFLTCDYGNGDGSGDGCDYGNGSGYGGSYGYGDGSGCNNGNGSRFDNGNGSGDGSGNGNSDGSGDGSGNGNSDGSGDGFGYGSAFAFTFSYGSGFNFDYGSGNGDRIKSYNGQKVYEVDCTLTLIYSVFGNYARGAILRNDLTLQPCYIAKVGNIFAHGKTLRNARRDAENKFQRSRPLKDRIEEFVENHPELDTPYDDLFAWHNILTGSCEMGRKEWCKVHGYKPTDSITVREFINGTENEYGGDVIRQLAERYKIKTS